MYIIIVQESTKVDHDLWKVLDTTKATNEMKCLFGVTELTFLGLASSTETWPGKNGGYGNDTMAPMQGSIFSTKFAI